MSPSATPMPPTPNTPSLWQLFASFCKIGTFTIGGGYAMIPLMEEELVERLHCLTDEEFLDMLALSQAMPGIFAVNMATDVGQRFHGIKGAIVSICGTILLPIIIMLVIAISIRQFYDLPIVQHIFKALRPVVVALIAAPVFRLAQSAHVTWRNVWIPLLTVILICLANISPVYIILATIVVGCLWWLLFYHKKSTR